MLDRIKKFLEKKNIYAEIVGSKIISTHKIEGADIKISGELPDEFPHILPRLYLLNRKSYGSLAHVGWNDNNEGLICKGVSINRHIDYSNPEIVYFQTLMNAIETLTNLLKDENKNRNEIISEFSAHWRFQIDNSSQKVISFIEHDNKIKPLIVYKTFDPKNRELFCLLDNSNNINSEYSYLRRLESKKQNIGKAIYIPVESQILPPGPNTNLKKWWLSLLNSFTANKNKSLKEIARHNKSKILWVILSVKIGKNNYSWICIKFTNDKKEPPPLYTSCDIRNWRLFPYSVEVHNEAYIKPRGGGFCDMKNKSIALVGCGSVGAEVAKMISAIGIGKLILVDFDILKIENIQRHLLGGEYIDYPKVSALKIELSRKYPYVNIIESDKKKLKDCLDESFLSNIDGIIIATGDPTEERFFNEELLKKSNRPWSIYIWVEGHGVGGHAIYVHSKGLGCLNCLYRNQYGEKSLNSIQNFLESKQEIAVDIAGCGTHFLPYSYIDAVQTAVLGTRLATYALQDKLNESCRVSWKGSNTSNLLTTYRYKNFDNSLNIEPLYWEGCDVCNKK